MRALLPVVCLAAGCRLLPATWPLAARGRVEGHVSGAEANGAWAVVYLEREAGRSRDGGASVDLRGGSAGFSPPLLAVAAGQRLTLGVDDSLRHRFFSSSPGNAFELPVQARGTSHRLAFDEPGLVRIYCSLHPNETGTVFVAPSRHFATVRVPGPYAIAHVPPGRYALRTWSDGAEAPSRAVTVEHGVVARVEVALVEMRP